MADSRFPPVQVIVTVPTREGVRVRQWIATGNAQVAVPPPLVVAVQSGHVEVVKALLEGGADHTIPGIGGTPLMFAAQQKRLPVVQALLNARANPNHRSLPNEPPMLHVVVIGCENPDFDVPLVRAFAAAGTNLAATDAEGKTARQTAEARLVGEARPFYKACYEARVAALKALGG